LRPSPLLIAASGLVWGVASRRILGPVDLEIGRGERVVLLGPNGAGKTTLLRLLAGLLRPTAGEVRWQGRPFAALGRRAIARHIAYVPQVGPGRVPLTVEQLVLQGRYPHLAGLRIAPAAADFEAVDRALETAGITALARRPLDELSGGERQAAFIAAALAQEADLLVLDEPTTHLDPRHQRDVVALIRRLAGDGDRTVVAATHDLAVAAAIAERVIGLRSGIVLADGPAAEGFRAESLERLFEASFVFVEQGGRRVPVLELPE
jgi:iron complex transport system ATP-binding protein